jgi:hypothetical protein
MIKILVEGDGEVKSLPSLFNKSGKTDNFECIDMQGKTNIVREKNGFEETIKRHLAIGYDNFCILMDADKYFYPYCNFNEELTGMQKRVEILQVSISVQIKLFWAIRAYESWIIGGLDKSNKFCNLINIKAISGDTQAHPPNPKEWLMERLHKSRYNPRIQNELTIRIDLSLAVKRNNSLEIFLNNFN